LQPREYFQFAAAQMKQLGITDVVVLMCTTHNDHEEPFHQAACTAYSQVKRQ
jgi:hypothetical protein